MLYIVALEYITSLKRTYILHVSHKLTYKIARLVHQSLAGQTPAYLGDDIQLLTDTDRRPLRSAAAKTCFVPRTRSSFGDRSFSAADPRA